MDSTNDHQERIAAVSSISDGLDRVKTAMAEIGAYQRTVEELSRVRREALADLMAEGKTQKTLAEELGLSPARLSQLMKAGPVPWRALLGLGASVTVAVGEKLEAPKDHGPQGPAVAKEDLAAYHAMSSLARDLGMDVQYETVSPPGMIDLNRDSLVVICGPRLSPLVQQLLASDPHIAFQKDAEGWFLEDLNSSAVLRPSHGVDYAYLGRLPRPDAKGYFLYIAGIHAIGAPGAVHYLTREISDLYDTVRQERFSCIVQCNFDTNRTITSSRRVTPVYLSGGTA